VARSLIGNRLEAARIRSDGQSQGRECDRAAHPSSIALRGDL